jgi:hypothetical protein
MFDTGYNGRIGDSFDLEGFDAPKPQLFDQMKVLTPADWNRIEALYDGEIAFTDTEIGALLEGLKERDLVENTLIVFLSDHGEEFNDHGGFGHGHSLYNELIRVPLILSLPSVLPVNVRLARQVRLLDVAPTILDILDIQPHTGFEGGSLKSLLLGGGAAAEKEGALLPLDFAYAEATTTSPEHKAILRYPWKIIYNIGTKQMSVYDLEADPDEQQRLSQKNADEAALLEQMLFTTLFGTSPTWYVQMAGDGEPHRFDLEIRTKRGLAAGRIQIHKLWDDNGRFMDTQNVITENASQSMLSVDDLLLGGELTLAFQIDPLDWPVELDARIDGRSALRRTRLGSALLNLEDMPFTIKRPRGRAKARGRPISMPDPPYIVVWLAEREYGGDILVDHDTQTKKELRALGYIQ